MKPILNLIATLALIGPLSAKDKEVAIAKKIENPKIEVCFVLDTTGSMGGLIQGAKDKIWSIANEIVDAALTPDLKIGLIGYRDRGDQYITKRFPLTDDIDTIYGELLKFQAAGGGDGPESVNQALHEAVTKMDWSKSQEVLKIVFLVGDAPPHMDYENELQYPEVCQMAMKNDLIINTIQCGTNSQATPVWKEIASKSEGDYAAILQSGGTVAISTPFDGDISKLNRELNSTVCGYGDARVQAEVSWKLNNNSAAAPESVATRASYLSKTKVDHSTSAKQISGNDDLISLLAEDKIARADIDTKKLPDHVAKMNQTQRNAWFDQQLAKREEAQMELNGLLKQRAVFVQHEKAKLAAKGKGDGFDAKVSDSLRKQAARKGIHYQ